MLDRRIFLHVLLHNNIIFCYWSYVGVGCTKCSQKHVHNCSASYSITPVPYDPLVLRECQISFWGMHERWTEHMVFNCQKSIQQAGISCVDYWLTLLFFCKSQAHFYFLLRHLDRDTLYDLSIRFSSFLRYDSPCKAPRGRKNYAVNSGMSAFNLLFVECTLDNGLDQQKD